MHKFPHKNRLPLLSPRVFKQPQRFNKKQLSIQVCGRIRRRFSIPFARSFEAGNSFIGAVPANQHFGWANADEKSS